MKTIKALMIACGCLMVAPSFAQTDTFLKKGTNTLTPTQPAVSPTQKPTVPDYNNPRVNTTPVNPSNPNSTTPLNTTPLTPSQPVSPAGTIPPAK